MILSFSACGVVRLNVMSKDAAQQNSISQGGTLAIIVLQPIDGPCLSRMLQRQPEDYIRFFNPFPFDEKSITEMLQHCVRDLYYGIYLNQEIAGMFMLRGWDAGYEVPSYGVVIDQNYSGLGIGRVTIEISKVICRLRGAPRLMLKVHPDNHAAKHIYEQADFIQTGIDSRTSHIIYHYDF
jgi:RimJ/RimL family protein N-acetyltransferase